VSSDEHVIPSIVWKDSFRLCRISAKPPSADIERQDD
jgi:hypothetical protein